MRLSKACWLLFFSALLFLTSCSHHAIWEPKAEDLQVLRTKKIPLIVFLNRDEIAKIPNVVGKYDMFDYDLDLRKGLYDSIKKHLDQRFKKVSVEHKYTVDHVDVDGLRKIESEQHFFYETEIEANEELEKLRKTWD